MVDITSSLTGGGGGSGKPAARITDYHTCPRFTGPIPHVGGPIITSAKTVMIGNLLAARVTDKAFCVGPTDQIQKGSSTVKIENQEAARVGDQCQHGGKIVKGDNTVLIGG